MFKISKTHVLVCMVGVKDPGNLIVLYSRIEIENYRRYYNHPFKSEDHRKLTSHFLENNDFFKESISLINKNGAEIFNGISREEKVDLNTISKCFGEISIFPIYCIDGIEYVHSQCWLPYLSFFLSKEEFLQNWIPVEKLDNHSGNPKPDNEKYMWEEK